MYNGCVMAVQAENSGLPAMLLPNATVQADPNHPYVKRLVAKNLLSQQSTISIKCVPSSLDIDNVTVMSAGTYSLTLQINNANPVTYSVATDFFSGSTPTPAMLLARLLQLNLHGLGVVYDGNIGSQFWLLPAILSNSFWLNTDSIITFRGLDVGDSQVNTLTILPTVDATANDLYPYLAKNGEASLAIHSCAIGIGTGA